MLAVDTSCASSFLHLFFFFQAEDGIRDLTVTGVQTCALPISDQPAAAQTTAGGRLNVPLPDHHFWVPPAHLRAAGRPGFSSRAGLERQAGEARSEERRVGKEV